MRENLQRWIRASLAKHFYTHIQTALGNAEFVLYMEGMPKHRAYTKYEYTQDGGNKSLNVPLDNFFELRVDGPSMTELSQDYWLVLSEVNILIATHVGSDLYKQDKHCGIIQSGFISSIMISEIGDGDANVGCMTLSMNKAARKKLIVSNFGQIHPVIPILQSTVEGHYTAQWSF
jgi:hypothetical protein